MRCGKQHKLALCCFPHHNGRAILLVSACLEGVATYVLPIFMDLSVSFIADMLRAPVRLRQTRWISLIAKFYLVITLHFPRCSRTVYVRVCPLRYHRSPRFNISLSIAPCCPSTSGPFRF
ncbi:hypothetical protein C8R43DRAFT_442082 [Mycena crocata]|nr:hypothetical protein C8R43DRAFT_442082 [Mycena crocata]